MDFTTETPCFALRARAVHDLLWPLACLRRRQASSACIADALHRLLRPPGLARPRRRPTATANREPLYTGCFVVKKIEPGMLVLWNRPFYTTTAACWPWTSLRGCWSRRIGGTRQPTMWCGGCASAWGRRGVTCIGWTRTPAAWCCLGAGRRWWRRCRSCSIRGR